MVGPRSISVVVDGEGHTLGNVVRDVAWLHPAVEFSGYSLEHPVYRHVNLRVQTVPGSEEDSTASAEQALAESLELTQALFKEIGRAMATDVAEGWEARKVTLEAEREKEAEEQRAREVDRAEKMARWVAMTEGGERWERELEIELFGKVISVELEAAAVCSSP